jgi:folate-binding protein YgfZ
MPYRTRLILLVVPRNWRHVRAPARLVFARGCASRTPRPGAYGLAGPDAKRLQHPPAHAQTAADAPAGGELRGEPLPESHAAPRDEWRAQDIAAGIAQITSATSGLWVAQMLNLDLLDGISFEKGCYTGQEVIARAHFRGQVKRRMQRFFTHSANALAPGARVRFQDGRAAQVVMAAEGEHGQEFLAVAATGATAAATESTGAGETAAGADSRCSP